MCWGIVGYVCIALATVENNRQMILASYDLLLVFCSDRNSRWNGCRVNSCQNQQNRKPQQQPRTRRTLCVGIYRAAVAAIFSVDFTRRRVFVCYYDADAVAPSFTSASQEIIVFEGETIEITCVVENLRKYLSCVCITLTQLQLKAYRVVYSVYSTQ